MKICKKNLLFLVFIVFLLSLSLSSCAKKVNLYDYLSECKDSLYYAQTEDFSLSVYCGFKESPYIADGIKANTYNFIEIKLKAVDNTKEYSIFFKANGKKYGGDMSFDCVKQIYKYTQIIDCNFENNAEFELVNENNSITFTASSVKKNDTLSAKEILNKVAITEKEKLSSLTENGNFSGEIYLRILQNDNVCFYYVGIIDKDGNVYALLIEGNSGNILSRKEIVSNL